MTKVASVKFPNTNHDYNVTYFDRDENAAQYILDFVHKHHCAVVLLQGFTQEEIDLLQRVPGVTVRQKIQKNTVSV